MKMSVNQHPFTTFVLTDSKGNVIEDFDNIDEHEEIRAIGIEPRMSVPESESATENT
ncbi:MAG: hypothetical protein SOZ07_08850 [Prevotella sp.]|nr:hypothetical protein [Prevotella sp.]